MHRLRPVRHNDQSNAGFSLVSTMLAAAIMGILAVTMTQMMSNNKRQLTAIELKSEKMELANQMRANIVCSLPCEMNMGMMPRYYGSWELQSQCTDRGLFISTRKVYRNSKKPVIDPVRNTPMAFKPLYKFNDGYLCDRHMTEGSGNMQEVSSGNSAGYHIPDDDKQHSLNVPKSRKRKAESGYNNANGLGSIKNLQGLEGWKIDCQSLEQEVDFIDHDKKVIKCK